MREAGRCGAMKTIIIGEDELAQNKVIVKNMASGSQQEIPMADITRFF
jgi:histidyl-tRNA synthetase